MRSIIIIPILTFLIPVLAFGQEYKEMNFKSGIWLTEDHTYMWGSEYIQNFCDGDTLIGDKLYYKLYKYVFIYPFYAPLDSGLYYIGAIRNTKNKEVEIIKSGQASSTILYDFNLSVGDTIKHGIGSKPYSLRVDAIDSIAYCGEYHRRYRIDTINYSDLELIEGIGCSYGFFLDNVVPNFESFSILYCYTEGDNPLCEHCDLLLTESAISHPYSLINVYPNPILNQIHIETELIVSEILIFDLSGNKVFQHNHIQSHAVTIPNSLNSGVYLLKIICDRGIFHKKIIVN